MAEFSRSELFNKSLARAISSKWGLIGVAIAAFSLASLISRQYSLPMCDPIALAIKTYRYLFHGIFMLAELPLAISIPSPLKDLGVLLALISGSLFRSYIAAFADIVSQQDDAFKDQETTNYIRLINIPIPKFAIRLRGLSNAMFFAYCFLFWPILLILSLKRPYMVQLRFIMPFSYTWYNFVFAQFNTIEVRSAFEEWDEKYGNYQRQGYYQVVSDQRIVLGSQLIILGGLCAVILFLGHFYCSI